MAPSRSASRTSVPRALGYLHHTASVAQKSVESLAVRLETLVITSSGEATRPSTAQEIAGQSIFVSRCASCYEPPNYTGPPVPLDVIGTDPTVGLSRERGTGTYRVPSLLASAIGRSSCTTRASDRSKKCSTPRGRRALIAAASAGRSLVT